MNPTTNWRSRLASNGYWISILLLALGLFASLARLHVHDPDNTLYVVISRNLAEDRTPFHLRFLPHYWPSFYEHLPVFFWVWAAALKVIPESALSLIGLLCGMGTVAVTLWVGRRLLGTSAAFWGGLFLILTEHFFRFQPRVRLDPPLTLGFTAAVALLIFAENRAPWLLGGGLITGVGVLIKGPPAWGAPVVAAMMLVVLGKGSQLRRGRTWVLVAIASLLPPVLFFAYDWWALQKVWWHGYVEDQFLASVTGKRTDSTSGNWGRLFLLRELVGRFWPGFPLFLFALWRMVRSWRTRSTSLSRARWALFSWSAIIIAGFSLAGRIHAHYIQPAYPPLALLAGSGMAELCQRYNWTKAEGITRKVVFGASLALFLMLPFNVARYQEVQGTFPPVAQRAVELMHQTGSARIGMSPREHPVAADLMEDQRVETVPFQTFAELAAEQDIKVALFKITSEPLPAGWVEDARSSHWRLAYRHQ